MATRTKKSGQRKAFAVGIAAFASVCLIATGFAAWVISAKAEKKETGNVNIGKVSTADIKIVVNQEKENTGVLSSEYGFSFNPQKDDVTGRVRNDGTNFENLGFTLTGTVGPQRFVTSFTVRLDIVKEKIVPGAEKGAKKEWEIDTDANARFVAAQDAHYITLPDCFGNEVDLKTAGGYTASTDTGDNAVAKFEKEIKFGWGSVFKGQNPGEYYDTDVDGKQVSDKAVEETLSKFYATLIGVENTEEVKADQNLNFRITLTAGTDQKA